MTRRVRGASLAVLVVGVLAGPLHADVNRWSPTGPGGGRITLVRVDPVMPAIVYAVSDGTPFRSTDYGATWSERSSGLPIARPGVGMIDLVIDAGNPSILNAITATLLFRSTDGGVSWTRTDPGFFCCNIITHLAADPGTPGTLYLVQEYGGQVYRSIDAGATWAAIGTRPPTTSAFPALVSFAVDPFQPSTFYLALLDSGGPRVTRVFVSTNAASTWTERDVGLPAGAAADRRFVVAATNPPTLYLGFPTGLFRTRDRGLTWSQAGLGRTDLFLYTVDPSSPTTLYGSSDTDYPISGNLLRSADDGATWTELDIHVPRFIVPGLTALAVDPSDPDRLYAGTSADGVTASTDGGATWTLGERGMSRHNAFRDIFLDPGTATAYVLSWAAALWKSVDDGETWVPRNPEPPPATGETFRAAMEPVAPQTLYLGSNLRGVFKSIDGAESWSPANTGLTDLRVSAVAVDPQTPGTVFAATPGGLFRSTDGAGSWTLHNPMGTLTALAVDPVLPGHVYGNDGALTSVDGGVNFAASGFLPPPAPNELGRTVGPLALAPTAPAVAYVALERAFYDPPGVETDDTLNRSVDGLATAVAVASWPIAAVEVDPSEPGALWATFSSRPFRGRAFGGHFDLVAAGLPISLGDPNVGSATHFGVRTTGSPVFLTTYGLGVFRIDLPACTGDAECDDGETCTTDVCTGGRCEHTAVADVTPCTGRDVCPFTGACYGGRCYNSRPCDDGDTCTDDYCLTSGECDHVSRCGATTSTTTGSTTTTTEPCPPGAPDADGDGQCDAIDPLDADLSIARVGLRTGAGTGRATLKGAFVVGPGAPFDALTGLALNVRDGVGASVAASWSSGDCETRTAVTCKSGDGRLRLRVSSDRSAAGGYKLSAKLRGLTIAGPLGPPITATLTQSGPRLDRVGTISTCTVRPAGIDCR